MSVNIINSAAAEFELTADSICPKHLTFHGGVQEQDRLNLTSLPFRNIEILKRVMETLHIHQWTEYVLIRGWPLILRNDCSQPCEPERRCKNHLDTGIASSFTIYSPDFSVSLCSLYTSKCEQLQGRFGSHYHFLSEDREDICHYLWL